MGMITPKAAGFLAAIAMLAGCTTSAEISQRNPGFVGVKYEDAILSGVYNPVGFTSRILQNQIKAICTDERLANYREQPSENGLVAFSASCAKGSQFQRAFMEIEKLPSGNYSVEILGS